MGSSKIYAVFKVYLTTGGHDFRPAYRKLSRLRLGNKLDTPMMALTATAALKVFDRHALNVLNLRHASPVYRECIKCSMPNLKIMYNSIT